MGDKTNKQKSDLQGSLEKTEAPSLGKEWLISGRDK